MVNHGVSKWSQAQWQQTASWHQSNAGQANHGNNQSWRGKGSQNQSSQDDILEQQSAASGPSEQAVMQALGDDRAGRSGGAGRGVDRTLPAAHTRAAQDQPAPGFRWNPILPSCGTQNWHSLKKKQRRQLDGLVMQLGMQNVDSSLSLIL